MRAPILLPPHRFTVALILVLLLAHSRGEVIINEFMAAASERRLQYSATGVPKFGTGTDWYAPTFVDTSWATGNGPFGFGTVGGGVVAIATNLGTAMQHLTPTLYLRKTFTSSTEDAAKTDPLQLSIQYNDGFVAYLNGVEVARRNAGPPKHFIFHDQPAFNRESFTGTAPIPTTAITELITLGATNTVLAAGLNVLAIHALNANSAEGTFYVKADLRISGAAPVTVVNFNEPWQYFVGVVEPSGTVFDPAQLGAGKLRAPWAAVAFDDVNWSSGTGPIGVGNPGGVPLGTALTGVATVTPSVYTRTVFNVTAAEAAETQPLRLSVQYDDGFVAYVNGVEVARRNIGLPNTFTPRDAVADSENSPTTVVTINLDPPSKLLVPGDNVLAIQVHNASLSNADLLIKADLRTTARTVVANNTTWKYLIGTVEPVTSPTGDEEESTPDGPDSASDWIELHNNGAEPVSLAGWRLTDNQNSPTKWVMPDVSIAAGGYLLIMADGLDLKSNPGGLLHTSFSLDRSGEFLGLFDAGGVLRSQIAPTYPAQSPFHSYARDGANWVFSETPTPGAANAGAFLQESVAEPTFSIPGRFYSSGISVTITCPTPGATIRVTTDGSEPTLTNGTTYTGPRTLSTSTALRARAFVTGLIPSETITHTYLIGQSAARRSLAAVCLTGDPQRALYRPFGVFAISPNTNAYTNSIWSQFIGNTSGNIASPNVPADPNAYNMPMQSGQPAERPVSLEILHNNAVFDLRTWAGLRTAGSPYSRPRYVLSGQNSGTPNTQSPWPSQAENKPQLNLFFRSDLGTRPLEYPLVPGSTVERYDDIRLRAGKNDISNPFIRDELCRRLLRDLGQVTVLGDFVNVYANGVFKGYYNITERPREAYFREARGTDGDFDVRYINAMTNGDVLAFNEVMTYARTNNNIASAAGYQGLSQRLDVVNFIDYLLMNTYTAMWDWPHNNFVMDRERSATGKWRFSAWDSEGGFGMGGHDTSYNSFTSDLTSGSIASETVPARLFYTVLRANADFRLLFADRIQRAFFNNGPLTDARISARFQELKAKVEPMIKDVSSSAVMTDIYSSWVPGRRATMLSQFSGQGLWPATQAPIFSSYGPTVAYNYPLTLTSPSGATATVYYTTNGRDPRAADNQPQGSVYSGPIAITQPTLFKARVRSAGGQWSPLAEVFLTTNQPVPLLISEIMYNPLPEGAVGGDEFEFIELKNTGAVPLNLSGMKFVGVDYVFAENATLAPGAILVLAKNPVQFAVRYPAVAVFGGFNPTSLNNAGEQIAIQDIAGNVLTSVTYGDRNIQGWPVGADGDGYSLVPVYPNANPGPNSPDFWRSSVAVHGSPGADDPYPVVAPVVINEVLANPAVGQLAAIELRNATGSPVDVSGWWLSNSASSPKKFRLPANTLIPANGFIYFESPAFSAGPNGFTLTTSGDTLTLNSADVTGALTGYQQTITFGAAMPGVSLGPFQPVLASLRWLPELALTLGAPNAGPAIGPVVITEIMFNPLLAEGGSEFIELRNVTDSPVPLFDPAAPANTWRLFGLEFSFPAGTILQPRQMALLSPLAPAALRTAKGVPDSVPVFQWAASSNLNDASEVLALQKPGPAAPTVIYYDVDAVTYGDTAPWPTSPDGGGPSLERVNWRAYGDDPGNWRASIGNDGLSLNGGNPARPPALTFAEWQSLYFTAAEMAAAETGGLAADPDRDGLANVFEYAHGRNPLVSDAQNVSSKALASDGAAGPFLTLQYRRTSGWRGMEFHVDTSGDLRGDWNLGAGVVIGTPVPQDDGTEIITARDTVPSTDGAQRFIRLRVKTN
ncbi:MAG: hypothetical protein JWQ44_2550 [Chthoniobacter sp.]|nr:hypothetical protein [Chthoniobacter sp.]